MKRIITILIIITAMSSLYARVAVLPYKIHTSDKKILNSHYSSLVSTAIALGKETEVVTPQEVTSSMELLGMNEQSALSLENLEILSKKLNLDYIVTGSLSKTGKGLLSKSLVFAAKSGEIILRESIFGQNIISLAGQESRRMLAMIPNKKSPLPAMKFDTVFMVDMSYHNRVNWNDIKKSVLSYFKKTMEAGTGGNRIYILPFSRNSSRESMGYSENSPGRLKSILHRMSPMGNSGEKSFADMLNYAMNTIKWRKKALKRLFIVTNSFPERQFLAAQAAKMVKKKGIHIFLVSGNRGVLGKGTSGRLVQLTQGREANIVYRQVLYDREGERHYLYMTGNRLFRSFSEYRGWEKLEEKISTFRKVSSKNGSLPEEIFSAIKFENPENIEEYFEKTGHGKILRKESLGTNISYILNTMFPQGGQHGAAIARALVFDGNLNLWVNIYDRETLAAFKKSRQGGFFRTTAFQIVKSSGNLYGLEFLPLGVSFPFNMVPAYLRVKFRALIKDPHYFTRVGLGEVPTWFIDVKVQELKVLMGGEDVREE